MRCVQARSMYKFVGCMRHALTCQHLKSLQVKGGRPGHGRLRAANGVTSTACQACLDKESSWITVMIANA